MLQVGVCQPTEAPVSQASSPNEYDDNVIVNSSNNLHFEDILNARLSRRQTVFGGISATTAAAFG